MALKDFLWSLKDNKRRLTVVIVIVLVLVAGVAGYLVFGRSDSDNDNNGISKKDNKNTNATRLLPRIIDGVPVIDAKENILPVAIMVENQVSSRPQAGLDKSNLVYEALAEGGITRFMAIYASGDEIEKIGPVRSARAYYLDWARELDSVYAHVGGSPEALRLIPQYDIRDLNQFYNSQYFWRAKERPAPHNLYTSSKLMGFAVRDKDYPNTGNYTGWSFAGEDSAISNTLKTLTIDFSTINYQVEYKYAPATNDYARYQSGQPHVVETGETIKAKNIIVQFTKTRLVEEGRLSMETIGEGVARIYRNGEEIVGTWKKDSREDRTNYYDASGQTVVFTPGTTWVEIVPTDRNVTYQ
ncbi:MAG: DUF3048 domain-containing protein [Patescibacteria group bacterium]|jgi:hypothetical protein